MNYRQLLAGAAVALIISLFATFLVHGLPSPDGLLKFLGSVVLFVAIQLPLWIPVGRGKRCKDT